MKRSIVLFSIIILLIPNFISAEENDLRFKNVYHKAFYKNPWIQTGIISGVIVVATAATTLTAGTGAPAAATGVSSVASWVAGGGAGSYMAGLSMVGSTFGGNAILGAAILNSASALTIGSVVGKSGLAIASKLTIGALQAGQLAVIFSDKESVLGYSIVIPLTDRIGGDDAERLVDKIKSLNENIEDGKISLSAQEKTKNYLMDEAETLFRSSNLENKVLAVVALHNLGYIDAFKHFANQLPTRYGEQNSFLLYIKSISALLEGNFDNVYKMTSRIIEYEPKVIEPVLINAIASYSLSPNTFKHEYYLNRIDKFSNNYYTTVNNKLNAYMLLADLSYNNENFRKAKDCYLLAYDETGWIGEKRIKASLCASIGNSYYHLRKFAKAKKYYNKAIDYMDEEVDIKSTFEWSDYDAS